MKKGREERAAFLRHKKNVLAKFLKARNTTINIFIFSAKTMTKPFLEVGLGCAGTHNETTVLPKRNKPKGYL